ncbi:MAG: single-stranded DNA-binding protein [bacterium]|jgi:single-strand DNA-binding protein|nr:single-stranded DNA-binding protein [bacterium]
MINHIVLVGRLTRDPEIRYTQTGIPVASFSIAVDRRFKNANGERETDFINLVAWRKQAELVGEYVKKGYLIGVEGALHMRKYQTREGENRTAYEVVCDNIQFLDRGSRSGGGAYEPTPFSDADAPPETSFNPPPVDSGPDDADLPF